MSDVILMLLSFPRHNTWSGEVPAAMLAAWEANSGHRFTSELLADFAASPVKQRGVEFGDARARHQDRKARQFAQAVLDARQAQGR